MMTRSHQSVQTLPIPQDRYQRIMQWVLLTPKALTDGARVLAGVLAGFDHDEVRDPSLDELAQGAGCSVRTVRRNLKVLENSGVIRRTHRKSDTTVYQFPELFVVVDDSGHKIVSRGFANDH